MDTQRLVLFFVFAFSLLMLWDAWQKAGNPPAVPPAQQAQTGVPAPTTAPPPGVPQPRAGEPPAVVPPSSAVPPSATAPATVTAVPRERVKARTDTLAVEIDSLGGDIVFVELLNHRDTLDQNKTLVLLGQEHQYFAQSGLIGPNLPNHRTPYKVVEKEAALAPGKDTLEVKLEAVAPDGTKATKIITLRRGSYVIDVRHEVTNAGTAPLAGHAYYQLTRDGKSPAGDTAMLQTYTGAAVYTDQEKFLKVAFGDIDKNKTGYPKTADNGWIAMLQHYFVAAILPPEKTPREFYTRKLSENLYAAGVIVPLPAIAPGATAQSSVRVFIGPQDQDLLRAVAPGLDLVVDYGWLTVIAAPLFWLLQLFHKWTGNWGLAIILLTVVIKAIFFPLSAASYRSMAKMKLVTPRLTKLREQYGDDRMKLNQAMMDLYKQEKINPLGGCLPIVVQIPVFIALYWALLASVELRHAPFYLWIKDLSAADPYFVLPALMMASMVLQTKMNPTPPDPVQAKVMMVMPFVFGVMFFFFPSGLVLYWLVNNILSIAQQWQITRMIEGQKAATAAKR
jgi:YidC/Oxa1 family membrane protein insertase